MGTYSTKTVPSVSMEIEAGYQDLSALLTRLIRDPGDIAAIQKLAVKQAELDRLEARQDALQHLAELTRPVSKPSKARVA